MSEVGYRMTRRGNQLRVTVFTIVLLGPMLAGPARATWQFSSCEVDAMDDIVRCWAASSDVPVPGPFPHRSRVANVGFGCNDGGTQWTYIWIEDLILTGGKSQRGYQRHSLRVRHDRGPAKVTDFTKDSGRDFLHFTDDSAAIENIRTHRKMLIEIPFYRQGNVVVRFDLTGSSAVIDETLSACGIDVGTKAE